MQARDQACPPAQASTGVRRHPQGGLLKNEDEPQESAKARRQEVVLRPHRGVRLGLREFCQIPITVLKVQVFRI